MRFSTSIFVVLLSAPFVWSAPVDSAVHITADRGDVMGYGSGTVIGCKDGKSLILTAAHVCHSASEKFTVTLNKKEYKASYLIGSKVTMKQTKPNEIELEIEGPDIALLVVDAELPVVTLSKKELKKGDRIHQWGFASGEISEFGAFYKTGFVAVPDAIWSTADSRRGDSGCGLFNDANELVGMVHARPANDDAVGGLAIPLKTVRDFLKTNAKDWKIE